MKTKVHDITSLFGNIVQRVDGFVRPLVGRDIVDRLKSSLYTASSPFFDEYVDIRKR